MQSIRSTEAPVYSYFPGENRMKKYIYMYLHNYNSRIIIYLRLTTSGRAYETEKLRGLHCTTSVRHLSIDSCKLAYYCLKLAVRDSGDEPNSTIRLSAPASLPTISHPGDTLLRVSTFLQHTECLRSHIGPSKAGYWMVLLPWSTGGYWVECEEER